MCVYVQSIAAYRRFIYFKTDFFFLSPKSIVSKFYIVWNVWINWELFGVRGGGCFDFVFLFSNLECPVCSSVVLECAEFFADAWPPAAVSAAVCGCNGGGQRHGACTGHLPRRALPHLDLHHRTFTPLSLLSILFLLSSFFSFYSH